MTTRFGVNYVPARGWWYSWLDWEPGAIRDDLRAIAALGLDHVRAHCLWPLFQPNAGHVSPTALDRLAELLDLADGAGLDVSVTVLDGWLSGTYFRPFWQHDGINLFTDPRAVDAELALLAAIAGRIGGHRRFLGFDIANEPNVLCGFPGNAITVAEGDAWLRRLLGHCAEVAPGRFHVAGVDHQPWLADTAFSRTALAGTGDATAVHAWILFTGALERYGHPATGTRHLGEYLLELAKAHHTDPRRPVWLQEFGVAPQWIPAAGVPGFAEGFTDAALASGGLWGLTWWASHDIDRGLAGFDDLEYDLGLLTVDNRVKPAGRRLAALIDRFRAAPVEPAPRPVGLVLPDGTTPGLDFADRFFALVDGGVRPAIVRAADTADPAALNARGITELVR